MESGQHEPLPEPKKPNPFNAYLRYSGLALQLLLTIGVFGWLGYKLDSYLRFSFPVFMLLFGVLALAGMLYQVYRSLNS
ncbi:MAG: AtpZ/AtpI family protein [Flammeovirgaceae bacterium]|nr:MAG: AtpZ/AtpI family protein [Flammeovirgaceae bacterium]